LLFGFSRKEKKRGGLIIQCKRYPEPSKFGQTFAFEVCQLCPAFIAAVHKVHIAAFTADAVLERAKAYWIEVFGFWA
jgi:hypothetical protein